MRNQISWREVSRQEEDAEIRVILVGARADGGIVVEERTDGEVTYLAYGTFAHVGKAVLSKESVQAFGACGFAGGVDGFFSHGETLLDFMDYLDAHEIEYVYTSECHNDIACRMLA